MLSILSCVWVRVKAGRQQWAALSTAPRVHQGSIWGGSHECVLTSQALISFSLCTCWEMPPPSFPLHYGTTDMGSFLECITQHSSWQPQGNIHAGRVPATWGISL